jgi:hypothetical protein
MKVFLVTPTAKNGDWVFQDVVPAGRDYPEGLWTFDGTLKSHDWKQAAPAIELLGGKRKGLGDFLGCTPGSAFAVVDLLGTQVRRILEQCGELLPVASPADVPISILNVAPLVDAGVRIDDITPDAWTEKFSFDATLLPARSLFKIQRHSWHIFATGGVVPEQDDFKATVERHRYTGLDFREVWNDDGGSTEVLSFDREIVRTTPGFEGKRHRRRR